MKDFRGNDLFVGDRVLPVGLLPTGWGDGVILSPSNTPATVVGFARTRVRVRFDGWGYGGKFPEFDAIEPRMIQRLESSATGDPR